MMNPGSKSNSVHLSKLNLNLDNNRQIIEIFSRKKNETMFGSIETY